MGRTQRIARNAGCFHHSQSYGYLTDYQKSCFHPGAMDRQPVPRWISKPHSGQGEETDGCHLYSYRGATDYIQYRSRQFRRIWAACPVSRFCDGTEIGNLPGYGFALCFLSGGNRAECFNRHHARACLCRRLAGAGNFPGSYDWWCFSINEKNSGRNLRHYFGRNDLHEYGTFVRFWRCGEESKRKVGRRE